MSKFIRVRISVLELRNPAVVRLTTHLGPVRMCRKVGLILAAIAASTVGVFSQSTKHHWLNTNVGDIVDARISDGGRSYLVATHQGVVGSLNAKNGSIIWRDALQPS